MLSVNNVRNFAYFAAMPFMGAYALALGIAALADGVLTRWVGWGGVLAGVGVLFAIPAAAVGVPYAMPLWLLWWLGVGISLVRYRLLAPTREPRDVQCACVERGGRARLSRGDDMRLPRLLPAALGAVLGVVGAVVAVVVARLAALDQAPVDQLAIAVAVSAWAAVAMLVTVARPGNRVGDLLALGVAAWGVGEGSLSLGLRGNLGDSANTAAAWLTTLGTASRALGWLVLVLAVPFVLPDGKSPWPGRRGPVAVARVAWSWAPSPCSPWRRCWRRCLSTGGRQASTVPPVCPRVCSW